MARDGASFVGYRSAVVLGHNSPCQRCHSSIKAGSPVVRWWPRWSGVSDQVCGPCDDVRQGSGRVVVDEEVGVYRNASAEL